MFRSSLSTELVSSSEVHAAAVGRTTLPADELPIAVEKISWSLGQACKSTRRRTLRQVLIDVQIEKDENRWIRITGKFRWAESFLEAETGMPAYLERSIRYQGCIARCATHMEAVLAPTVVSTDCLYCVKLRPSFGYLILFGPAH